MKTPESFYQEESKLTDTRIRSKEDEKFFSRDVGLESFEELQTLQGALKLLKLLRYKWVDKISVEIKTTTGAYKVRKQFFNAISLRISSFAYLYPDLTFDSAIMNNFHQTCEKLAYAKLTTQEDINVANQTLDHVIDVIEMYLENQNKQF